MLPDYRIWARDQHKISVTWVMDLLFVVQALVLLTLPLEAMAEMPRPQHLASNLESPLVAPLLPLLSPIPLLSINDGLLLHLRIGISTEVCIASPVQISSQ